jgi:hypothetical protein
MHPSDVLAAVEHALLAHFGHRPLRASVSFVGVEPIEVLRFEPMSGERVFVTLGMSRHPMTGADEAIRSANGPRAELVLRLRDPADRHAGVWRRLAVLAAAPAVEGVVYTPGMTVDIGEPMTADSRCTGVVVTDSGIAAVDTEAGPVTMLQAVPATPNELAWCRVKGSAGMLERWAEAGSDLLDLGREPVRLD